MFQAAQPKPGGFTTRTGRKPLRGACLAFGLAVLAGCGGVSLDGFTIPPSTATAPPNSTRGLVVLNAPQPVYPLQARTLGIEGWVMLAFTVDESGTVIPDTIDVINQQPTGYFERASINAARRMNFDNILNRMVRDVRYVFQFELDNREELLVDAPAEGPNFREYLSASFVTPQYPEFAREQGLEGHVVVEFTITENGGVRDLAVIEANPPAIFDQAALRAASRLRYQPRVVDNEAVAVEGVTHRFNWNLP